MARTHKSSRCGRSIEALERRTLLAAAGSLDTSFSGDGKATLTSELTAIDVAVQADGKTVVAGTAKNATSGATQFALARFNVDGSLDSTFGVFGVVNAQLSDLGESSVQAVAIAPDGKIVVVGDAEISSGGDETEMAIARFNPDGALDNSFSGDGKQTFDLGGTIAQANTFGRDVAVQPDGRIIVVGDAFSLGDRDFAVIRLNVNGSLDRNLFNSNGTIAHVGFDGDGKRTVGFGETDRAQAVKLDDSGNIYVAGHIDSGSGIRVGVTKLNTVGARLAEFNGNGQASFSLPGRSITSVQDLLIQPGGKVVITGHSPNTSGANDFFAARFGPDGKLDLTFGGQGKGFVVTDLGGDDVVGGIVQSPVGNGFVVSGRSGGMAMAKYSVDGMLDPTFGTGGIARLNFGTTANIARGPGRRLTVAGGPSFATARVLESGARIVFGGVSNTSATEGTTDTASLIVGRIEALPVETRVFFNISGSANGQLNTLSPRDFTTDKFVLPGSGRTSTETRPYVVIPPNETIVIVTLTAIDDAAIEGIETATFTVLPDATYEIGTPNDGTVRIFDNEANTVDLSVADDSYVRDGQFANTAFGSAADLQVKTSGSGFNRRSYLKFDLSNIGIVHTGKLTVSGRLSDGQNTNVLIQLFPVANTSWNGSTLTFNNKPPPGSTPLASINVLDTALRTYTFDVTNYLKQEKSLGHNVVSFMLLSPNGTGSNIIFNSGNATSGQPKLTIVTPRDLGVFAATPPAKKIRAGQDVQVPVTWTVPLGSWRQLTSITLRLRDLRDPDSSAVLRFNESTNSFELSSASGVLAGAVSVLAEKSTFQASSPSSPTVTATFTFRFRAALPGHRFAVEVSAANDEGQQDPFVQIGTIRVKKDHAAGKRQ